MFADFSPFRRVAATFLFCFCVAILVVTLLGGLSDVYAVRLMQILACALASIVVFAVIITAITTRLADYREPADEEEFEQLVRRSEQLARDNLAWEPDEEEFLELDPAQPARLRGARAAGARRPARPAAEGARPRRRRDLRQGRPPPRVRPLPGRHGVARQLPRTGSSSSATRCCATSATTRTSCARRSPARCGTSWRTTSARTSSGYGSWACDDRDDAGGDGDGDLRGPVAPGDDGRARARAAGRADDGDRRDRRPRGRARARPRGHGRRRPRGADLAALQARLVRAGPP